MFEEYDKLIDSHKEDIEICKKDEEELMERIGREIHMMFKFRIDGYNQAIAELVRRKDDELERMEKELAREVK